MKIYRKKTEDELRDFGFGTKIVARNQRLMHSDGSSNIRKKGLNFFENLQFYHSLIKMSWTKFNLIVVASYIVMNLFFACLYEFIGIENLAGVMGITPFEKFTDSFFFSAQTLTTLGYGRINPMGNLASTVAAIESMVGLLGFALATGLLYGRFSRPRARLVFSKNAVVAPYQGINGWMFRFASKSHSQLLEVEVSIILTLIVKENGIDTRKFFPLELERNKITMLSMSWTVVHPIDDKSPLKDFAYSDLEKSDAEFLIFIKGFDDTFADTIHSRTSYKFDEVIFGAKFITIIGKGSDGSPELNIAGIHEYEKADLNIDAEKLTA
ncbi:MAG: K+ channel, inward rectifier [Bacteroidia bacterium]|nr:K+ channel, inward rectifier [Bacteroidia bacterium]